VEKISLGNRFWGWFNGIGSGGWGWGSSLGDMARASRWQLVGIDEKSTIRITRVQRKHSVINILLSTLGLITRSQKSTSRVWSQASFQPSSLSVIVMTIRVVFGNMLENDPPVSFNIDGSADLGVNHFGGA